MAGKMTCMGVHAALTLTIIFVSATNNIAMANDNELVPADKSQLNKWFQANLAQKATLDPALAAAEANPKVITVKKDGSGDFKTLTDAINSIPAENTQRVIVNIGAGEYKEKITIPRNKPFVTLLGSPNNMPTVTFDGTAAKYGTVDSATLIAESDYFVGANLIIKNTSPKPDGKTKGAQALAIRVSGNKSAFYNCKMHGFQDTLCDDKGLHVYKDCYIEGTVDFIFGSGKSLFLNTELNVISDPGLTVIAAHARDSASEDTGYSFVHCRVTGTGTDAFLGRAWRASPQVVYSYTNMDKNVNSAGWNNGNKPEHEKTVFFGEYQSMGPGASVAGRAKYSKQLTNAEAKPFLSLGYVQASKWLLPPPTSKL